MKNAPRVSVLLPAYNVENYIEEAISSILQQTYTDFEFIIINDASTDKTEEKILSIKDSRIKYFKNETNLGLAETLNKGIKLSSCEYIARMDGDDICLPHRLEKQINVLDKKPHIGICGASYKFFGLKNSKVILPANHSKIKVGLLFGCNVTLTTFRRSLFTDNNLHYSTDYFPAEDYKMWADCSKITRIYNIPEILFLYRMHAAQISTEKREWQKKQTDRIRLEMLNHLYEGFSLDEKEYHVNRFIPEIIESGEDLIRFKKWKELLLEKNKQNSYYHQKYLKNYLKKHLKNIYFLWAYDKFSFSNYNLRNYLSYLVSGLFWKISFIHNLKIFIKYILQK